MKVYNIKRLTFTLAVSLLVFSGCSNEEEKEDKKIVSNEESKQKNTDEMNQNEQSNDQSEQANSGFIVKARPQVIEHIHGIGYPGNDNGLYIASHEGLKIYKEGKWLETQAENHDYMGFQAVEDGFLASGHPEEGSSLKNPFGLVKSTDFGQSLEKLAYYGESDFHFLAASYQGKGLYIINEHPNSDLGTGVYVSKDDGKNWAKAALDGFESNTLGMMAVHPEKEDTFAMATKDGIYLSNDAGQNVKKIGEYEMVTAATMSKDFLFFSPIADKNFKLTKLDLGTQEVSDLTIPTLNVDNPIIYITTQQKQDGKIAFITYQNDLYESTDDGKTWKQLLAKGKIE